MNRVAWTLAMIGLGATRSMAALLYDCSNPDPPIAFSNLDENVIMMDDVLVPTARLNGGTRISIASIQDKIYISSGGTYNVTAWIGQATIIGGVLQPSFPVTNLGTQTVTYGTDTTADFTVGDGVNQLVSMPVLPINYQGNSFGVFFYGLSFNAPLQNIGWCLADEPDANIDAFYGYYGPGDSRNGVKSIAGYRASFNIRVNGSAVPEPAPVLLLGLGLGMVFRRRIRSTSLARS